MPTDTNKPRQQRPTGASAPGPLLGQRIIDRDVAFYTGEVEECQRQLRNCIPSEEPYWQRRWEQAIALLNALTLYRIALDSPKTRNA